MKLNQILEFIVRWFSSAIIACYFMIYRENEIGFKELTAILIATLIGVALWELTKRMVKKMFN